MEDVAVPAVELNRATLAAFADVDPREGSPLTATWRRASFALTETEAITLPASIGSILTALVGDADRLAIAMDIVATFDLVETLPDLVALLSRRHDPAIAAAAGVVASNPF